jgi:hypothetical protein
MQLDTGLNMAHLPEEVAPVWPAELFVRNRSSASHRYAGLPRARRIFTASAMNWQSAVVAGRGRATSQDRYQLRAARRARIEWQVPHRRCRAGAVLEGLRAASAMPEAKPSTPHGRIGGGSGSSGARLSRCPRRSTLTLRSFSMSRLACAASRVLVRRLCTKPSSAERSRSSIVRGCLMARACGPL